MAQDTTEQPNTLTLRINAAAEYVLDWLVEHTRDAPAWKPSTEPGKSGFALSNGQRMRYVDGPLVRLTGWSVSPERGDANQTLHNLGDVLAFKVRALSADRCEVIVRSGLTAVDTYLAPVLERMAESYPECRLAIDQHLARSGEASPAVDQMKPKSRPGRPVDSGYDIAADRVKRGDPWDDVMRDYFKSQKIEYPRKNNKDNFASAMRDRGIPKPRKERGDITAGIR